MKEQGGELVFSTGKRLTREERVELVEFLVARFLATQPKPTSYREAFDKLFAEIGIAPLP